MFQLAFNTIGTEYLIGKKRCVRGTPPCQTRCKVGQEKVSSAGHASTEALDPERMLVARPKASWQSLMHFRVAVKPDGHPTAVHIVDSPSSKNRPDRFLVGDEAGALYVFSLDGSLIAQHHNPEGSTITALASARVRCDASDVPVYSIKWCSSWPAQVTLQLLEQMVEQQ